MLHQKSIIAVMLGHRSALFEPIVDPMRMLHFFLASVETYFASKPPEHQVGDYVEWNDHEYHQLQHAAEYFFPHPQLTLWELQVFDDNPHRKRTIQSNHSRCYQERLALRLYLGMHWVFLARMHHLHHPEGDFPSPLSIAIYLEKKSPC